MKKFILQLVVSAGGQVAVSGRALLLSFVFASALGKSDYGAYSILVPVLLFAMSLGAALIFEPMTFILSRAVSEDEGQENGFGSLFILVCAAFFLIATSLAFVMLRDGKLAFLILASFYVLVILLLEFSRRFRLALMDIRLVAISDWVVLIVISFIFGCAKYFDVLTLVGGLLVVSIACLIQAYWLIRAQNLFVKLSVRSALYVVDKNSKFIGRNFLTFLASLAYVYANPVVVFWFYGLESNANVEATRLFLAPLHLLNMAIGQIGFQFVTKSLAGGGRAVVGQVDKLIFLISPLLAISASMTLLVYPYLSSVVFGGAYAGHSALLMILSATYVVEGAALIAGYGLKVLYKFKAINCSTLIAAIVNVIFLFFFSGRGAEWIIAGKTVSSLAAFCVMYYCLRGGVDENTD